MSDNYPVGARYDKDAPYNKESKPEIEVEVSISVTLSKTVKVRVDEYDEEEEYYNVPKDILDDAVKAQIVLPQDTYKDWIVDDFQVIKE